MNLAKEIPAFLRTRKNILRDAFVKTVRLYKDEGDIEDCDIENREGLSNLMTAMENAIGSLSESTNQAG